VPGVKVTPEFDPLVPYICCHIVTYNVRRSVLDVRVCHTRAAGSLLRNFIQPPQAREVQENELLKYYSKKVRNVMHKYNTISNLNSKLPL